MMDLDFWGEDFLLARNWGLDLPVQLDVQYGDIKLNGDFSLGYQLQAAVEEPLAKEEDALGLEWMESSDLGSLLDALGGGDKLLPLETSLLNFSPLSAPEDSLAKIPMGIPHQDMTPVDLPLVDMSLLQRESYISLDTCVESTVNPVFKLESAESSLVSTSDVVASIGSANFFSDVCFSTVSEPSEDALSQAESVLNSPLSADDVASMLSCSGLSSPSESSQHSLIEASPELYKIISTSSIDSVKFSPYSKCKQNSKTGSNSRRTRKPAELVPEYVILEQIDKKGRKKLQNKNAAIKYRIKKRQEAKGIKSEEDGLEEINQSLKTEVGDLLREVKYMKNLMEEVCKAKGLI